MGTDFVTTLNSARRTDIRYDFGVEITKYHAKYFAHELTKRSPSSSLEKLSSTLSDAQVDLNPHQIEAALFAFKSPLSKGALLADEVGLGKTIEAGLVISQKWAERKRKILLIVPSSLRKQWNQELLDKFFIPSFILEAKSFNTAIKEGNLNPFNIDDQIVITSYHFARSKSSYLKQTPWDLVVIDEAHRLRNVYKTSNKIARELRDALSAFPKILLTATPLQNSLLELYGLVSFIDEHVFGDIESFKNQFARVQTVQSTEFDGELGLIEPRQEAFDDLRERLKPVCKRTLRKQVLEYIKYTNRIPLTQDYYPGEDETRLYEAMTEFLQRDKLYALPSSQRQLVTLILRKLLASSSYAIASTLNNIVIRLNFLIEETREQNGPKDQLGIAELAADFEAAESLQDEWIDDDEDDGEVVKKGTSYSEVDIPRMEAERDDLIQIKMLAEKVFENSKAQALLSALEKGFEMTVEKGAKHKALIFTESTVTQKYLYKHLEEHGYAGKIVRFNGSNNDDDSKRIYADWLSLHKNTDKVSGSKTADTRAALVDHFKNEAEIMIATEAAAEGVNLQFCSLVINFDLPWNPQRIEQRIGRCHRYGQKHDVVVLNFINRANAADQRVYELLDQKFNLFKGVFGVSDEVLGTVESGVGFEKRIAEIYQNCRSEEEITRSFDALQEEMETSIAENMKDTRQKLLENFDAEVHERLRVSKEESELHLEAYERWLWDITKFFLGDAAEYSFQGYSFTLNKSPFPDESIYPGPYRIGKNIEDAHIYRPGHPLAQKILSEVKATSLVPAEVIFNYSGDDRKISVLDPLIGKSGELKISQLSIDALEAEDHIVVTATVDGELLDSEVAKKLFLLPGEVRSESVIAVSGVIAQREEDIFSAILTGAADRNSSFFDEEMEKLDKWAEDLKRSLELELKQIDIEIKTRRTNSKKISLLEEKLAEQRAIKDLEKKRNDKRLKLYEAQDGVDKNKEDLIGRVERQLFQNVKKTELFAILFSVV